MNARYKYNWDNLQNVSKTILMVKMCNIENKIQYQDVSKLYEI